MCTKKTKYQKKIVTCVICKNIPQFIHINTPKLKLAQATELKNNKGNDNNRYKDTKINTFANSPTNTVE